jgi:uncharacterized protein YlxW (UPF0749 family)
MMNSPNAPVVPSHDAIKVLADLLTLVASPADAKRVVDDLVSASAKHKKLVDEVKAEQAKLTDLRTETETAVAVLKEKTSPDWRKIARLLIAAVPSAK